MRLSAVNSAVRGATRTGRCASRSSSSAVLPRSSTLPMAVSPWAVTRTEESPLPVAPVASSFAASDAAGACRSSRAPSSCQEGWGGTREARSALGACSAGGSARPAPRATGALLPPGARHRGQRCVERRRHRSRGQRHLHRNAAARRDAAEGRAHQSRLRYAAKERCEASRPPRRVPTASAISHEASMRRDPHLSVIATPCAAGEDNGLAWAEHVDSSGASSPSTPYC